MPFSLLMELYNEKLFYQDRYSIDSFTGFYFFILIQSIFLITFLDISEKCKKA